MALYAGGVTERKPHGMSFESWVDKQIREATERGEFANLPGAGKPIPGRGEPDDELWWLKGYARREGLSTEELLPASLRLRRQIERLPQTLEGLRSERAVRDEVDKLNAQIVAWLRVPSDPLVPLSPVDVDEVVEQWRAGRRGQGSKAAAAAGDDQDSTKTPPRARLRWWQRWRGSRRQPESG